MATRSRTRLFKEYRDNFVKTKIETTIDLSDELAARGSKSVEIELLPTDKHRKNRSNSGGFESDETDHQSQTTSLPPQWVNSVQQITPEIEQIKKKIGQLVEQHKKHLLGFDERAEDERAIEILTAEITRMFQKCQERIKHIGAGEALTPQELLIRQNIQATLAQQLQALSLEFRRHQKEYLQRLRGRQERGARLSLTTNSKLEVEGDTDDDSDFFIDKGFTSDQLQILRQNSQEITQREREIRQIVKSIRELAELFNDLALLVKEQGTIIDRIDYTIEQTATQTKRGVEELSKAAEYQKKSTSCWCMGFILLLILAVIVFIIIKVT